MISASERANIEGCCLTRTRANRGVDTGSGSPSARPTDTPNESKRVENDDQLVKSPRRNDSIDMMRVYSSCVPVHEKLSDSELSDSDIPVVQSSQARAAGAPSPTSEPNAKLTTATAAAKEALGVQDGQSRSTSSSRLTQGSAASRDATGPAGSNAASAPRESTKTEKSTGKDQKLDPVAPSSTARDEKMNFVMDGLHSRRFVSKPGKRPERKSVLESHIAQLIRSKSTIELEIRDAKEAVNELLAKRKSQSTSRSSGASSARRTGLPSIASLEGINVGMPPPPKDQYKVKEGYLYKKAHRGLHRYQKRWFYLIKNKLIYFKKNLVKPSGCIPLELCAECVDDEDERHAGRFTMKFGDNALDTFRFDTEIPGNVHPMDSKAEKKRWISAINCNIRLSKKRKSDQNSRTERTSSGALRPSDTWKVEHGKGLESRQLQQITWREYGRTAKTGDILLFKTKGKTPALIRFGTGSEYDHVGLVVKIRGQPVGLLESLGEGVNVASLLDFKYNGWWKTYSAIVARRLHADLSPEQQRGFETFITTVVGRKYGFWNPAALYRKKSLLSVDDPDRSFFCSELVAAAFKQVGLLRQNQASCTYFPGSFSEYSGMQLLQGAFFGKEVEVIFDKSQRRPENAQGETTAGGAKANGPSKKSKERCAVS